MVQSLVVNGGATQTFTVPCNTGEVATGGGYASTGSGSGSGIAAYENRPNPATPSATPTGWVVSIQNINSNNTAGRRTISAYAICVPA